VQDGPNRIDHARAVLRQELDRQKRGAARRRARVVEPTPKELELLTKTELANCPIRDGPFPIVAASSGRLELVVPFLPQRGQLALGTRLREPVGLGGCLDEGHAARHSSALSIESGAVAHRVTLIPGDGTGPELTEATRRVLEATGVEFDWDVREAGADVMEKYGGNPLPDEVLEAIRETGVALKGPITTPVGGGFRSVNVALRKSLDLYGQVRPCKTYPGVRTRFDDVDLIIVRENTEDLYAGIEYEQGSDEVRELIEWIKAHGDNLANDDAGISIKPISVTGTRRIVQFAFDYARRNGRSKVTAVHKANIMKFSDGLFLRVAQEVAAENDDIEFNDRIVDNMCMQLVQRPEEYDVLVLPNLYGDVLSDLCAGMIGGLGLAPGGNFGESIAIFEPTHGSAPKYAGQNKVNPMAQMLSGMLMLRHLDEREAADNLERAIAEVIKEGKSVTYDMKPTRSDPSAVGTSQVAEAIIEKLGVRV
jgi:isocitrate dehydrogenase (NAD+)